MNEASSGQLQNGKKKEDLLKEYDNLKNHETLYESFCIVGQDECTIDVEVVNKNETSKEPIIDIELVFPRLKESVKDDYEIISSTPGGTVADLLHSSIKHTECFITIRRGFSKMPIVDIGILDESNGEQLMADSVAITQTRYGNSANISGNKNKQVYLTFRRLKTMSEISTNEVVTDICVINASNNEKCPASFYKIDKVFNKSLTASNMYICYKKSRRARRSISYSPKILDSFSNDSCKIISPDVANFCMPNGVEMVCWPINKPYPEDQASSFVLTDDKAKKTYATCLTFYEIHNLKLTNEQKQKLNVEELSNSPKKENINNIDDIQSNEFDKKINDKEYNEIKEKLIDNGLTLYTPIETDDNETNKITIEIIKEDLIILKNKTIVFISKFPFNEGFKTILDILRRYNSLDNEINIPVERILSYLMYEVVYPAPKVPQFRLHLFNEKILFNLHDIPEMPLSGARFIDCLNQLGVENMITIFLCILQERTVIFHSMRHNTLSPICETFVSLIFPLFWQCPYVPLCISEASIICESPVPVIAGIDSKYFDVEGDQTTDAIFFGIDTQSSSLSNDEVKRLLNSVPSNPLKILRNDLESIHRFDSFPQIRAYSSLVSRDIQYESFNIIEKTNHKVRRYFLKFMSSLLKGYDECILPLKKAPYLDNLKDIQNVFDFEKFIRSKDRQSLNFFKTFVNTQMFRHFIQERIFHSEKNEFYFFFDDIYRKCDISSTTTMYDNDDININMKTIEANIQCSSTIMKNVKKFKQFPNNLNKELYDLEFVNTAVGLKANCLMLTKDPQLRNLNVLRSVYELKCEKDKIRLHLNESTFTWPRIILFEINAIWFSLLPNFLQKINNKLLGLNLGINYLFNLLDTKVIILDQQPFRVIIHLCGFYGKPYWSYRVLQLMECYGIMPDCITLPIYHKAITAKGWPSENEIKAYRKFKGVGWVIIGINYMVKTHIKISPTNEIGNVAKDINKIFKTLNINENSDNEIENDEICNETFNPHQYKKTINNYIETNDECKDLPMSFDLLEPNKHFMTWKKNDENIALKNSQKFPELNNFVNNMKKKGYLLKIRKEIEEKNISNEEINEKDIYIDCLYKEHFDSDIPITTNVSLIGDSKNYFKIDNNIEDLKKNLNTSLSSLCISHEKNPLNDIEYALTVNTNTSIKCNDILGSSTNINIEPLGIDELSDKNSKTVSESNLEESRRRFLIEHLSEPFSEKKEEQNMIDSTKLTPSKSWFKTLSKSPLVSKILSPSLVNKQVDTSNLKHSLSTQSLSTILFKPVQQVAKNLFGEMKTKWKTSNSNDIPCNDELPLGIEQETDHFAQKIYRISNGLIYGFRGIERFSTLMNQYIESFPFLRKCNRQLKRIELSIASRCTKRECGNINYDEEIWTKFMECEESSIYSCYHCGHNFTPLLTVKIFNNTIMKKNSYYQQNHLREKVEFGNNEDYYISFPVRFLNPVYLRMILETQILSCNNYTIGPGFFYDHQMLYYNLLYYFKRTNMLSHLNLWCGTNVQVICTYDVPELHEDKNQPLYLMSKQIISEPILTETLLKRPPFRFLFDIISETIRKTSFLSDKYTEDILKFENFNEKSIKISFLDELISIINNDGSLDELKGSKIVAGKDSHLTNLFLQKFAKAAKDFKKAKKKKKNKESSDGKKDSTKNKSNHSEKKLKIDKTTDERSSSKSNKEEENNGDNKSKEEKKLKKNEKENGKHKIKEKDKIINISEEEINHNFSKKSNKKSSKRSQKTKEKNSSITQENNVIEEEKNINNNNISLQQNNNDIKLKNNELIVEKDKDNDKINNHEHQIVTSPLIRPGTAVARPPPPKLKKNQIIYEEGTDKNEIDTSITVPLITEEESKNTEIDDDIFVTEEIPINKFSDTSINVNKINEDQHGILVNKIVENTKNIEKDSYPLSVKYHIYDDSEYIQLKEETDELRKSIQHLTQTIYPLAQIFDFIQEDFDEMLRELDSPWNSVHEQILLSLESGDFIKPMTQYIATIRANKTNHDMVSGDSFSMYRDFLFSTLDRYGTRVDIANFDFYYREAFEKIPPMIMNVLPAKDYAPSQIRMANRRIFIPLDLV
ncbi:Calmodulin-binding protein related to a Rab3 GDP/GTP exchange protein [Strongyloides ratti]|uniref:Calmodulin-binding protein related to a Rab3 GDP/GTP exchange protein n=1 Tax=Strongyloides ratti TaxID=34506 RepID=A0A090LPI3_STRRB|nr:Calmodulin-binding protein related to a Rab3 GDP/GTP exchange protein [Strongyloides ratti]CEF71666.1 Calmodulin-binding protein related to a Rab3 GDP/GTP exchange protein [Strongyloides ratti]